MARHELLNSKRLEKAINIAGSAGEVVAIPLAWFIIPMIIYFSEDNNKQHTIVTPTPTQTPYSEDIKSFENSFNSPQQLTPISQQNLQ